MADEKIEETKKDLEQAKTELVKEKDNKNEAKLLDRIKKLEKRIDELEAANLDPADEPEDEADFKWG